MGERAVERDEAWIEKYRAALQDVPVKRSRFESLVKRVKTIRSEAVRWAGKILGRPKQTKERSAKLMKRRETAAKKIGRQSVSVRAKRKKAG